MQAPSNIWSRSWAGDSEDGGPFTTAVVNLSHNINYHYIHAPLHYRRDFKGGISISSPLLILSSDIHVHFHCAKTKRVFNAPCLSLRFLFSSLLFSFFFLYFFLFPWKTTQVSLWLLEERFQRLAPHTSLITLYNFLYPGFVVQWHVSGIVWRRLWSGSPFRRSMCHF